MIRLFRPVIPTTASTVTGAVARAVARAIPLAIAVTIALGAAAGCTRSERFTARPGSDAPTLHDPLEDSVAWIDSNLARGHRDRVERYFWARLVRAPAADDRRVLYAMTLADDGDALRLVESVLAHQPRHYWAHVATGRIHAQAERWDEAAAAYRRCIAISRLLAEGHLGLAAALRATGRADEAEAVYQGILVERPYDARVLTALGDLLRDRGAVDEALDAYRRAAAADRKAAAALVAVGEMLWERGDADAALEVAERAAEADPDSGRAHVLRARLYAARGWRGRAAEAFARAVDVDPERMRLDRKLRYEAATERGTYALEREDWASAAARFAEAVTAKPDDPRAHRALATARFSAGDYAGAVLALLAAERLAAEDESVGRALAAVLKRIGVERLATPGAASLADARAAVERCFEAQRYRFPSLAGRIRVHVTAASDGRVSAVRVDLDTVANPELRACAVLHFHDARLEPGAAATEVEMSWEKK